MKALALGCLALFPVFVGLALGWLGFEIARQVVTVAMEVFS